MAETFFGVSMIPMYYKNEVRQIKSKLLCFLRHPTATHPINIFDYSFRTNNNERKVECALYLYKQL